MQTHKIFVVLIIFLTVSAYADDNPTYGFTEAGCGGSWEYVTNWVDLYDYCDDDEIQVY